MKERRYPILKPFRTSRRERFLGWCGRWTPGEVCIFIVCLLILGSIWACYQWPLIK